MTSPSQPKPIVVGIDGTAASAAALRWAAEECLRREVSLHAVHVVGHEARLQAPAAPPPTQDLSTARQRVPARVADILHEARLDPALAVKVVAGSLVDQLARESEDASLLVVGLPDGPDHGETPAALAEQCHCPVTVVTEDGDARVIAASGHAWQEDSTERRSHARE